MSKKVVFTWGRYNPPTIGHKLVMDTGARVSKAQGADFIIFASKTNSPANKNPLSFKDKIRFLKQSFPKYKRFINDDPKLNTLIRVMQFLDKSYDEATIVVGSDRKDDFLKLLNRYNGQDYDFRKIDVALSGDRDPDAEDASGMSASKMRKAAADGDYEAFKMGSPIRNPKALYDAVRKGMHITEYFTEYLLVLHEDIDSGRFNRLLRLGLVPTSKISVTKRAFSNFDASGPQASMRDIIFDVSQAIIDKVLEDDLVYQRFIQFVATKELFTEDQRDSLLNKSHKSGIPYASLLEVYFRGLLSYDLNEELQHQCAFNRVNSFIAGGKSRSEHDVDIWNKYITLDEDNKIKEIAPPGAAAEKFIKANKKKFKSRYGDNWEKVLYATAWKVFG